MSDNSKSSVGGGGIGFCSLLTVLFIGLKLTGHIAWSWVWVLSPMWLGAAVAVVLGFLFLALAGIVAFFNR